MALDAVIATLLERETISGEELATIVRPFREVDRTQDPVPTFDHDEQRRPFELVKDRGSRALGESAKPIASGLENDFDTRRDGESRTVEDDVIKPRIVLAGPKEHAGVGVPRLVDFSLSLSRTCLVNALRDNLCNAVFDFAIQTDAEYARSFAQYNHPRPSENDRSGGVRHFPKC